MRINQELREGTIVPDKNGLEDKILELIVQKNISMSKKWLSN